MQVRAKQTVYKQVPPIHILYLVKHQIGDVGTIQLVYTRKHSVEIFRLHVCQTVIVEVDITVSDAAIQQHLMAECRFTASTHTNNYLCHFSVELEKRLLLASYPFLRFESLDFLLLLCQYLKYYLLINHNLTYFHSRLQIYEYLLTLR